MGACLPGAYSSSSTSWNAVVGVASNTGVQSATNYQKLIHQQQLIHQQHQLQLAQAQIQQQYGVALNAGGFGVGGQLIGTGPLVPTSASRMITKVVVYDIYGYAHAIDVDSNVLYHINSINQAHSTPSNQTYNPKPQQAPLDADFSLDELERAEKLMEEMSATA